MGDEKHQITEKERYKLKRFVKELDSKRGSGTELVSIYVPQDYNLDKIRTLVKEEQGTASNIKSKSTRDNVIGALEKIYQHLKLFPETPPNGLAVFSGDVSERDNKQNIDLWSIEPPVPINQRLYRCDKDFVLDPLKEIADDTNTYGLIVMDRREGNVALLKGKTIIPLVNKESRVPGKFKTGGQCLTQDSVIQCSDGSFKTIDDITPQDTVTGINTETQKLHHKNVKDAWRTGEKKTLAIKTKHPQLRIECSPNHLFPVQEKNNVKHVAAENLKPGMNLLTPSTISIEGEPQELKPTQYYSSFTLGKKGQLAIKQHREKNKLYQKELGRAIGVTQTTIRSYENGTLNVDRKTVPKILQALSISKKKFFSDLSKPYKTKEIHLPTRVTEDLAYFLGYYTGDGDSETDRISLFEENHSFALQLANYFSKTFNTRIHVKRRKEKNYTRIRITSRPLTRLLEGEFPEITYSRTTRTPNKIARSPRQVIQSYLSGLFDAEGYARPERGIGIGLNNKILVREIQMLLLRCGIISSLYTHENKNNPYSDNRRFSLSISEKESLTRFKEKISFKHKEKQQRLKKAIEQKSERSNVRQLLIDGETILTMLKKHGYSTSDFPTVSDFFQNKRRMSKNIFRKRIYTQVNASCQQELKKYLESEVIPATIKEIEERTKKEMVDITVEEKLFIANSIITHNSAQRFARIREGAAKDFYRKIGRLAKEQFYNRQEIQGILVGGPGHTKHEFIDGDYLPTKVKENIISIQDLSYTGDYGLEELVEKSKDVLAKESVMEEKRLMEEFFSYLNTEPGKVTYGEEQTMKMLKMGVVKIVLISEEIDEELVDTFIEEAEKVGSDVEIISTETTRGNQLAKMGGIAAINRYNAGY